MRRITYVALLLLVLGLFGCNKLSYLAQKYKRGMVVRTVVDNKKAQIIENARCSGWTYNWYEFELCD